MSTLRRPTANQNIQDRPIAKTRGAEVSLTSWQFMFAEIITYTQKRVAGITDFEKKCVGVFASVACELIVAGRLNILGYRVGYRLVELLPLRDSLPVCCTAITQVND